MTKNGIGKNWMGKQWIGTAMLVGVSVTAGLLLPQVWEQVLGQHAGFHDVDPQVVVQQQPELPKCLVDFVTLPLPNGHPSQIRVITVVDTEAKKIAVYHMDLTTGGLQWLSTRAIQPDLAVHQFNARSPLPSEVAREVQRLGGTSR